MSQSRRFRLQHDDLSSRPSGPVPAVTVSERLALSLRALGAAGEAWLAELPGLLAGLEADWSVTVGARLDGGHTAYVAEAVTRDGTPVVLKVSVPPGVDGFTPFGRQLAALQLAGGDPYARLIRYDVRARPCCWSASAARWRAWAGLRHGRWTRWRAPPPGDGAPSRTTASCPPGRKRPDGWRASSPQRGRNSPGRARRRPSTWPSAVPPRGRPPSTLAGRCSCTGTCTPSTPFRYRGRLARPSGSSTRKASSEPAHDLGVIIVRAVQGWIGELAVGDPQQALETVARHSRRAARLSGADPEAVWQWTFTELVSTGLFLLRLDHHEEGGTFLATAGKLAVATANGQPGRARRAGPGTRERLPGTPAWRPRRTPPALAEVRPGFALTQDPRAAKLFLMVGLVGGEDHLGQQLAAAPRLLLRRSG